jgi:hypothetical protein
MESTVVYLGFGRANIARFLPVYSIFSGYSGILFQILRRPSTPQKNERIAFFLPLNPQICLFAERLFDISDQHRWVKSSVGHFSSNLSPILVKKIKPQKCPFFVPNFMEKMRRDAFFGANS